MSQTRIEWADSVWNPVTGCTPVSAGCEHCYAARMAKRLAGRAGYPKKNPFAVTLHPDRLEEPYHWKKPRRVFVCSMGDLFHEDVPDDFIFKVFEVMSNAQFFFGHAFMVLTKRPARMKNIIEQIRLSIEEQKKPKLMPDGTRWHELHFTFPLQNIWLGVSAENQDAADERIPILLEIPAAVRFVSVEPMLGPIDMTQAIYGENPGPMSAFGHTDGFGYEANIQWVIAGGETGPGARPIHPEWIRDLRDQCTIANVPFFFKSWGLWGEFWNGPSRCDKKAANRLLDGHTWDQYPGQAVQP
jgi:protein gp37